MSRKRTYNVAVMAPKTSYSELEEGFLLASYERRFWLDRHTGKVISYSREAAKALEDGDVSDLPEWMHDDIEAAREVLRAFGELPEEDEHLAGTSGQSVDDSVDGLETEGPESDQGTAGDEPVRFVSIEQIPSFEAFEFMADFISEVARPRASEALSRAVRGNKPFRRFKDALFDFPEEGERWSKYEASRRRTCIEEWARDNRIELNFGQVL